MCVDLGIGLHFFGSARSVVTGFLYTPGMQPPQDTLQFSEKSRSALALFAWGAVFFVIINVVVYVLFDVRYFQLFAPQRLLMNPSDNQIESLVGKVNHDPSVRHIIFLGDSITWGVSTPAEQTFVGIIQAHFAPDPSVRVLNFATPGDTFFDIFSLLRRLYRPQDTYVVVLDPLTYYKTKSLTDWSGLARFNRFDAETLDADRMQIRACCRLDVPHFPVIDSLVHRIVFSLLPLYRNRDTINTTFFRLSASNAATALVDRALTLGAPRVPEPEVVPALEGLHSVPYSIQDHPLRQLLTLLASDYRQPNILYVLADDATYLRDDAALANVQAVQESLSGATVLNLHAQLQRADITGDGIHLTRAGHRVMADRILSSLKHLAP